MRKIQLILAILLSTQVLANLTFTATGRPSFIKITGETTKLTQELKIEKDSITGTVTVNISDLTTGIDLRDEHLKDKYLEVKKFPMAKLELPIIKLEDESFEKTFEATLTLHGVVKKVSITSEFAVEAKKITANSQFSVNLEDFNIEIPSYQGITVAKEVKINVQTIVKK